MKKLLKKLIVLGFFAAGSYFVYKIVIRIRQSLKLSKSLPLFLKNTIGEAPVITINMKYRSLSIGLKFSADTLARETDIEELVREYIEDFYPALADMFLTIRLEEKAEEKELKLEPEEPEETEVEQPKESDL